MNKIATLITVCAVALGAFADRQVYRLERDSETERIWLVGQDGLSRECKILAPEEYELLMGELVQTWTKLNATDSGRSSLHGKVIGTVITNGCRITTYKDGYQYAEAMQVKTAKAVGDFAGRKPKATMREQAVDKYHTKRYSEFKQKMKERNERVKNSKPKTVTVEHDAATGKDIVK